MATDRYGNIIADSSFMNSLEDIDYKDYMRMSQDPNSQGFSAIDKSDPVTTAQDVRDLQDRITPDSFLGRFGLQTALNTVAPPVGAMYKGFTTGLGAIASGLESLEGGVLGDALDSRTREGERDLAESQGFSRSQTQRGAEVDAGMNSFSGYSGFSPGVSDRSGYGLDPGLSDMSSFGSIGLGDMSFGGFDMDSPSGFDLGANISAQSTDLGETGLTTRGALSGTLGDSASGSGRGDDGVGDAPGHDPGSGGARGEGNEGTSSPGGIGGY